MAMIAMPPVLPIHLPKIAIIHLSSVTLPHPSYSRPRMKQQ